MTAKILSVSSLTLSAILWGMASFYGYQILRSIQKKRTVRYEAEKHNQILVQKRLAAWAINFGKDWVMVLLKGCIVALYFGLLVAGFGYIYAAPLLAPEVFEALPSREHLIATITWCAIPVVCAGVLLLIRSKAPRKAGRKEKILQSADIS